MSLGRHARGVGLLVATWLLGCGGGFRPFSAKAPLVVDQDQRHFAPGPEEYYSSFLWDGADQMAFRPMARLWAVDPAGAAINVNAVDEVPDSSWFINRIHHLTPEDARLGPCKGQAPLDMTGWTVTGAKPNGANPGFPIKTADGRRYMVKFDGVAQGPRATAGDVIGSKIYYAAGFSTPCNEVVFFDRKILAIDPKASSVNAQGEKVPMTDKDLDTIFSKSMRLPDGRYRASTSLFLAGKPIGPFRYEGTRSDDPNDVVAHEDRRDLRGTYVLGSWINHFDAREQNTLDMFVAKEKGGPGYVQHSIIDFGDCLGSIWEPPMMGRRIGHSHYFAGDHVLQDFLTFGLLNRPWDDNRFGKSGPVFGYYKVSNFKPDAWRPGYPNPAMLRMTEPDGAWMARIIAQMTPAHVRAMLEAGQIQDAEIRAELERIVLGRRKKILWRYLTKLSALTRPRVSVSEGAATLCVDDLALKSGVFWRGQRRYGVSAWTYDHGNDELKATPSTIAAPSDGADLCVKLTASGAPYMVVDLMATPVHGKRAPLRVHLARTGESLNVVGVERPETDAAP